MSFEHMIQDFKNEIEKKKFMEAQYNTITELTKKLAKAEEKVQHLEKLLESGVPSTPSTLDTVSRIGEEELICRTQINLLRKISDERQLTLEEARKVEIYNKILLQLNAKNEKDIPVTAKEYSEAELLKKLTDESAK